MKKNSIKSNPQISDLISKLKRKSREHDVNIWRDIAVRLEKPRKSYAEVNVSKINRYASEGEILLVPGKVLGSGALDFAVHVAALSFSDAAIDKIAAVKGKCMTIEELVESNPTGSKIRILR